MRKLFYRILILLFFNCKQVKEEKIIFDTLQKSDSITTNETITSDSVVISKKQQDSISCKESSFEMESETICVIKNTTLQKVYQNLIQNKEIDASEHLLKEFPKNNKSVEITEKSLFIDYKASKNKLEFEMSFAGGVTTISLEKIGKNVQRIIHLSAD